MSSNCERTFSFELRIARSQRALLVVQGFKRPLQWEDMFALPHSVECANVYPEYADEWKKQLADGERTAKVRHPMLISIVRVHACKGFNVSKGQPPTTQGNCQGPPGFHMAV